jgi:tetratricopeptide (TPR) repeat protein
MVRNRFCQNVNLLKIAKGGFSAVVEPSLETAQFSMMHCRDIFAAILTPVCMSIRKKCDEKSRCIPTLNFAKNANLEWDICPNGTTHNTALPLGHAPRNYFRDLSAMRPPDYFCHRAIFARQHPLEALVKPCVLILSILLLAAGAFASEPLPATAASDSIFLWLASGISSARIQRLTQSLAQSPAQPHTVSCHATMQCTRSLQKAGADADLINSLAHTNSNQSQAQSSPRKSAAPCTCSSPAVEIAALAYAKNFDAAADKIRALLQITDDQSTALLHFLLGTILRRQDRFDEALDEFTESSKLAPGFPEAHNELSYLLYRTDDADNALAEARTALSIDPANAEAYRYLGLALYADGHYDAALHAFDESLQREPAGSLANADVYFDMGITHRDQGDPRRAAIAYRHALSLRPDFWEAHSNLGVVLHDQGKMDEAIAEYRAAKRLKPEEASVRNNLGNTLCDKEDFDAAIVEFNDLYRQSPDWEGGHNCLARAYMSKRDYPSAIRELQVAIAENPAGAAEHRVLGQALLLTGRDQEAVDILRKAITLNPESGLGHHYLGTALVNTQQLAEAEKEFREALRLEPSAENHFSLAACLMARNQFEEALGELEIASRMDPTQNLYRARMQEVVRLITASK